MTTIAGKTLDKPTVAALHMRLKTWAKFHEREARAKSAGVDALIRQGRTGSGSAELHAEKAADLRTMLTVLEERASRDAEIARLREALERAQAHVAATGSNSACWKRGVMMAVERLDTAVGQTSKKRDAQIIVERVRRVLDDITDFQRNRDPDSYKEAFRISEEFNKDARVAHASTPRGEVG